MSDCLEKIRYAEIYDRDNWLKLDGHLSEKEFYNKTRDKMGLVLTVNEKIVGILRYNLFWDSIPFCNMIYIDDGYRGVGFGLKLMSYWENEMKTKGYDMLMLSTRSDEDAQHFYRKLGYKDCGCLFFDEEKYKQPAELFFMKPLA